MGRKKAARDNVRKELALLGRLNGYPDCGIEQLLVYCPPCAECMEQGENYVNLPPSRQ